MKRIDLAENPETKESARPFSLENEPFSRILLIANPGLDQHAIFSRTAELALENHSKVFVVAFVSSLPGAAAPYSSSDSVVEQLVHLGNQYFDESTAREYSVMKINDRGRALAKAVDRFVEANNVDLVVKTGHRSEGVTHCPEDWHLNRMLDCKILILPEQLWAADRNMLVALDIDASSKEEKALNSRLIEIAVALGDRFDRVTFISTLEVNDALMALDMLATSRKLSKQGPTAKEKMLAMLDDYQLDHAEVVISAGDPAKKILSNANRLRSQLVVLGSSGRQGLSRIFRANTAENVMHHLRTDLLIIK